jgi:hypothetical protein
MADETDKSYDEACDEYNPVVLVMDEERILVRGSTGILLPRSTPFFDRFMKELRPIVVPPTTPKPPPVHNLFVQDNRSVPIPKDVRDTMDPKAMAASFDNCMKSNPPPEANALPSVWHDFLSELHAQWIAQRWPNTEAAAMCLQAKLGSHENLQWTRGDNLQAYLENLSFNVGTQGSLRKRNRMANYEISAKTRLPAHWGNFRRRAADELDLTIPHHGTEEVRNQFLQRLAGSPYERAWENTIMHSQFKTGLNQDNWLEAIIMAQQNHAAPQQPTAVTSVNRLNPQGKEYLQAVDKAGKPKPDCCIACNSPTHGHEACSLVALFKESFSRKFTPHNQDYAKKYFCPLHGHQNSHEGTDCFTLKKMRADPAGFRKSLTARQNSLANQDQPDRDRKRHRKPTSLNTVDPFDNKKKSRKQNDEDGDDATDGGGGSPVRNPPEYVSIMVRKEDLPLNAKGSRKN